MKKEYNHPYQHTVNCAKHDCDSVHVQTGSLV
uniref:Uncharacterized protein n=1 Tax=Arundo donax TaxID=35708 RepID=A0A0A9HKP3_ARUDO